MAKTASLDPGIFGVAAGVGQRPMAATVQAPPAAVPLLTITAAKKLVTMPVPRSYCGRDTAISMATGMGWLARG